MAVAETSDAGGKPRLVGLDLLRLLAVALVLGRHMGAAPRSWPSGPRTFFALWERGGWIGVDLFFVLSGFLVSGLLFAEFKSYGRISPLRFYARRAWKIYPPYFVMLAVTVIVILAQGFRLRRIEIVAEALFFQNYVSGIWNHTWSLAVEEHFYLLLPVVCLLVLLPQRRRPASLRPILLVGAGIAVCELALRIRNALDSAGFTPATHVFATHLRLDSLFFGVLLSYAYHFHTQRFVHVLTPWRVSLMLGGILCLAPAFLIRLETSPLMYTVGYTVVYIGSGMLMVGALLCDVPRRRVLGGLATLGASSYSIYLWHMPVFMLGMPMLEQMAGAPFTFGVRVTLYLGAAIVLGVVMARLVEVPALRLRDHLLPSRAAATIGARRPRSIATPAGSAVII
jgi:peptidoglycan/LPS O-acetylase OafA/YrhL